MSYDYELFTKRKHVIKPARTGAGSNIGIEGPYQVEEEDLPDAYLAIVGKKRILYRIHVEGYLTPSDQAYLNTWLGAIITETSGVLIDLQTDFFETRTKSGRLQMQSVQPDENGRMSFYFEDGEKFYQSGFEEMLRVITLLMPEAAPRRFGYTEPLQSKVENNDFSELVSSFKNDTCVIMKSKTPFGHINLTVPCKKHFEHSNPKHFIRREFLVGVLSFEIRPKLLSNSTNFERLKIFFEELCLTLDILYAEIVETDACGSWFWHGLPDHQAHTICIGVAYRRVWPAFLKTGYGVGDHHHIIASDRFGNRPPCPPRELLAPDQSEKNPGGKPDYAFVFPFDYEYDYNKYIW